MEDGGREKQGNRGQQAEKGRGAGYVLPRRGQCAGEASLWSSHEPTATGVVRMDHGFCACVEADAILFLFHSKFTPFQEAGPTDKIKVGTTVLKDNCAFQTSTSQNPLALNSN